MTDTAPHNATQPLAVEPEVAAKLINSTTASLEKDRSVGHLGIPYVKVGRRVVYCVEDLLRWLESHKVQPTCESQGAAK